MSVRQAGAPIVERDFTEAMRQGGDKRLAERFDPMNAGGPFRADRVQCRLYPRFAFFFDGTGNNRELDTPLNRLSNVAKLFNAAVNDRSKDRTFGLRSSAHVHDSVAAFTQWPCALYDPRKVFCDDEKYYADIQDADARVAMAT